VSAAGGPYAAFVGLPCARGGLLGAGASPAASSSSVAAMFEAGPGLDLDLDKAEEIGKAAFDLAREVQKDQEKWNKAQEEERRARRERQEALKVPDTHGAARPPAPATSTEVTLCLVLPDGRSVPQTLKVSDSMFDVQQRIFMELRNKELHFESTISGSGLNRKLDDEAFSKDLQGFGLQAGKTYEVTVSQPSR